MRPVGVMRSQRPAIAVLIIAGLLGADAFVSDAQIPPEVIQVAIYKTVHLFTPHGRWDNNTGAGCTGSFVTPNGLILTAAHCVRADEDDAKEGLVKGQLINPDGLSEVALNQPGHVNPVPFLVAQRVVDTGTPPNSDLALLRPVALLGQGNNRPLPADFRVPGGTMTLRDSETVQIGEPLAVLGFPAVGGESITVVQGHVTGFDADKQNHKIWMKHDAAQAPGHSGGPIIDVRGQQVAVVSWRRAIGVSQAAHAAMTSRIPAEWAQYLRGGTANAPAPSRPAAPGLPGVPAPQPSSPYAPTPQPPRPSTGAVLRGRIVDASSGAGIPGAVFVIFRPGTSLENAQKSDVVAFGQTDGNGVFQTSPPVPKGATYPAAGIARGYRPIGGNLEIPTTASDVLDFTNRPFQLQGQ